MPPVALPPQSSRQRVMRGALAFALALVGCGSDVQMPPATPDAKPSVATLTILDPPGASFGLTFGERVQLRVLDSDESGAPIGGAAVGFALVADADSQESAGGATLSSASALTGGDGIATVDVVAGAASGRFRVVSTAPTATPVTFFVTVGDQGFATLQVTPRYLGTRSREEFAEVEVRVFSGGVACASLDPTALPSTTFPPFTFDGFDQAAEYDALSAADDYAVLAWGHDAAGRVLAVGCLDLAKGLLRGGSTVRFDIDVDDLPTVLSKSYALTSTFDISGLAATLVTASPFWKVALCPRGAAQLLLDCAIDALDSDDPLDCVIVNPGPSAQALQAARGALDANGCRGATVGSGQSLEAKVMATLTVGAQSPAAELAPAAVGLGELLGTLTVTSTLTPAVTWATHTLTGLELDAAGATYQIDPGQSSRPIVTATVPMSLAGSSLTLGDHGFTLRLGRLTRDAFQTLILTPAGVTAPVERYGEAMVASTPLGCPTVSQVACAAAGLDAGCLTPACSAALPVFDGELLRPFTTLDALGIDFHLSGLATVIDADHDLVGEVLSGGIWTATLTLGDGTSAAIPGAFQGAGVAP